MFPVRLAVVGSRTFADYDEFTDKMAAFVGRFGLPDLIISGGALGADTFAERYADTMNIPTLIFHPNWEKHGRAAGIKRNAKIVNECTHLLAFCVDNSRGTMNSVERARKKGVYCKVYHYKLSSAGET